ncbi:hypothetical protein HDU83_007559 [Entophlyctis luteolus]|nr:hypothetical protein HDU83_007559 [Entophlyctis luteolus]
MSGTPIRRTAAPPPASAVFSFLSGDRPKIAKWLNDSHGFFAGPGISAQESLVDAFNRPNSFNIRSYGSRPSLNVQGAAINLKIPDTITQEDILEDRTVHEVVRLIAVLGNHQDAVRVGAVHLLVSLAKIFNPKLVGQRELNDNIASATMKLMINELECHSSIHELFSIIAPAFNAMAINIVAGLETFLSCVDPSIRGVCISALSRIVLENEKVFVEEDHLAAIWNLYLSLGSIAALSKIFSDRIVIIKSLGLLAHIYASVDSSLTYGVIGTLMKLENKTQLETIEIKETLSKIFDRLPELDEKIPAPDSHKYGSGYNFFLSLLNAPEEFGYDLLPWAIQRYTQAVYTSKPENKNKCLPIPASEESFPPLDAFIKSLTNHFRANAPLVRYGSSTALHSVLEQYPKLIENNPRLLIFVVTGLMDSDYLSSFMHLTTLELICSTGAPSPLKVATIDLITKFRHKMAETDLRYDKLYFEAEKVEYVPGIIRGSKGHIKDYAIRDIVESISKFALPLAPKLLHKLVNAFEYLSKTVKLKHLEIVRVWGSRSEKIDSHLMQVLFPMLRSSDEDIKLAVASVVQSYLPQLAVSPRTDIDYCWSHLQSLVTPETGAPLLSSILEVVKDFPLERLSDGAKEDLLTTLFHAAFHPAAEVRFRVYIIVGSSADFWRASSLWSTALGILFLCLGDHNPECVAKIIEMILVQIDNVAGLKELMVPLGLVKDSIGGSVINTVKAFDNLANSILKDKPKLHELIDALTIESTVDKFWNFFLNGVTDSQMVKPDDYDYTRNFIHEPFWIAIILTKLSMTPPPISVLTSNEIETDQDLIVFIDLAIDLAFNSPSHTIKVGALELLETFVVVFPSGSSPKAAEIRDVVRSLITGSEPEVCKAACRIYPLVFRCVTNSNAKEFYGKIISEGKVNAVLDYLISEIEMIKKGPAACAADPMLSSATKDDLNRVIKQSLISLGTLASPQLSYPIIQELYKYLRSDDHDVRYAAFVAITNQAKNIDTTELATVMWILLPLYADSYKPIRIAFVKLLHKLPTKLELLLKLILPHSDDSFIMNNTSWEDLLMDGVSLHVNLKVLGEIATDLAAFHNLNTDMTDSLDIQPEQDDGFNLPRVSQKLMIRFKEIAKDYTTLLPDINISQVIFQLLQMQSCRQLGAYVLLVISEFCCSYESILTETMDILLANLSYDMTPEKTDIVQAAVLGLKNISGVFFKVLFVLTVRIDLSPSAFKQMLSKVISVPTPNDGELFNLFCRTDSIRDFAANKAPELLKKYAPIITSHRFSLFKKLYSIYLTVELSLIVGQDEIMRILDALQVFVETNSSDVVEKIHSSISKLLGAVGPKHTIFRTMLGNCRKFMKSKNVPMRQKALQTFQIFLKHLPVDEVMTFVMLFLADSSAEVIVQVATSNVLKRQAQIRSKARQTFVYAGIFDFAIPSLKNKTNAGAKRSALLETGKLPSVIKGGLTSASDSSETDYDVPTVPLPAKDPYNAKYYGSDRRRKFTSAYGLSEAHFSRASAEVTLSVLEQAEESVRPFQEPSASAASKYQWMLSIESPTLLHECMKQFPQIAEQVLDAHIVQTEGVIESTSVETKADSAESATSGDIENETHIIDVLANLLIAYDGVNTEKTAEYLERLRIFIASCNGTSDSLREGLFQQLEDSFYFFNEFLDVPITSEEQFVALEALKEERQKATLEAVKSGITERLSALDMKKAELDEILEDKSELLRRITILGLHALSCYSVYYALSRECPETSVANALQFIAGMLENEHRGIRMASVEAFLTVAQIQLENPDRPEIHRKVQDTIRVFLDKLVSKAELYRRKADYVGLVSQLLVFNSNPVVVLEVLVLLVKLWKDPDSEVRLVSIKMLSDNLPGHPLTSYFHHAFSHYEQQRRRRMGGPR